MSTLVAELTERFGPDAFTPQSTQDEIATLWVDRGRIKDVLRHLKYGITRPFKMLYDLTAIDERIRKKRGEQPASDFTVVYHLLSFDRNEDVRLKVPLREHDARVGSITDLWPAADWYECEAWDMFGVRFDGHPHLRRILMSPTWEGHPLRKDHPARATEMGPYTLPDEKQAREQEALRFQPEAWGMKRAHDGTEFMFLNLGPNHPSAHGVFRVILQLDGEEIVEAVPEIGYHHRGKEKMAERQSWHSYIPYTDRVDYLGGVMNNFPYVLALEKMAGIEVPERAKVIRIMLAELFRIGSHLLYYGTYAQDIGQLSPVFFLFTDRERMYKLVEAVTGFRMHPAWFRIGGVAADLPQGWEALFRDFIDYMPKRLDEYEKLVINNRIIQRRTKGIGAYTQDEAIDWAVTGPNLRACGFDWDFRKRRPYGGYDQFEFDIPIAQNGDAYDRLVLRAEEIRQSLRIIQQCVDNMPAGPYKALHPLATPPPKDLTLHDIETLITHFLNVSWGPVMPAGECCVSIEGTKGYYGYYLISDGGSMSYRTRIRTASFPHLQTIPLLARGLMVPDFVAVLGSLDFVMADVDR